MDYYQYIISTELTQPIWLYIFIVIAIIISFKRFKVVNLLQRIHHKYTYKHTYYKVIEDIIYSQKDKKKKTLNIPQKIYYLIISGLLFLSLAGPYQTGEQLPTPPNNRDIIFVVDNAVSMVLQDYFIDKKRVERLTMVKSVLLNFANKLSGNRIGIVTFSESAHTLLPLTTDTNLIKQMIPRIDATLTGRTSNPQKALLYTLNYLHNNKSDKSNLDKPTIVLITDILRPPRDVDPDAIARYIGDIGYKLFVVAIGASSYKKSDVDSSTLIYHPASFERLKSIAASANGKFYWAKNTDSLNETIQEILKTKKSKILLKPEYIKTPLFQWPLALSLILIFLQYFLSNIRYRISNG